MGEDGSEALVEWDERDSREAFLKRIHERAYLLHGSTVLTRVLFGLTYNDLVHCFASKVVCEPIQECMGRDSEQWSRCYSQGIGDGKACSARAVVNS